jgi:hypothetical protein
MAGQHGSRHDHLLQRIAALPDGPLSREDLCSGAFRLHAAPDFEVHYAPFWTVTEAARIALVGITPGWRQMELAFRAARDVLRAGGTPEAAGRAVRARASLAGMRNRVARWLDGIGVHDALGIATCAALFGDRRDLLHMTSAVRHPVFLADGRNWSGSRPDMLRTPVLRRYVEDELAPELARVPDALIVPLGTAVDRAVGHLVDLGALDGERCLTGFPHPSGANVGGEDRYRREQPRLRGVVAAWAVAR